MNEVGVFTPEQARLLWQDYQTRQQLQPYVARNYPQRRPIDEPSPHRVFVRNDSGETCPAYGCMMVTGTTDVAGVTVVTTTKPTATTGEFLFCSPYAIADGACGWAYRFGIVIALGANSYVANSVYDPTPGEWTLQDGGELFVAFGPHNAAVNGLIGRFALTSGGAKRIRFTITDVHCPDPYDSSDELYVSVEWTYYTGGCSATPPGVEYDGTIKVYDACILDYYTSDSLIGKEGSATYFYPRDDSYCSARWIVDSICGQPECDQ